MELTLTSLLSIVAIGLFGQNAGADKKVIEIESFKRYEITKLDNKDDLKGLSDSTIEVTEMVNYLRKSKNNLSGKVTENSKSSAGEVKRTYYFNEQAGIFAIVDDIKRNDNTTERLRYYFGGGQLTQVIDENNNEVTKRIDKQRLYYWIARMFTSEQIAK
jgi:hypothetical protein